MARGRGKPQSRRLPTCARTTGACPARREPDLCTRRASRGAAHPHQRRGLSRAGGLGILRDEDPQIDTKRDYRVLLLYVEIFFIGETRSRRETASFVGKPSTSMSAAAQQGFSTWRCDECDIWRVPGRASSGMEQQFGDVGGTMLKQPLESDVGIDLEAIANARRQDDDEVLFEGALEKLITTHVDGEPTQSGGVVFFSLSASICSRRPPPKTKTRSFGSRRRGLGTAVDIASSTETHRRQSDCMPAIASTSNRTHHASSWCVQTLPGCTSSPSRVLLPSSTLQTLSRARPGS